MTTRRLIHDFPTVPVGGEDYYTETIARKLRLYPDADVNLQRMNSNLWPWRPIRMDISPAERCNLACPMCIVSTWDKRTKHTHGKRVPDMTSEQFKQIIDQEYGLLEIKLQGLGEPLLNSDLITMIRYARSRGIWVRVITNGTLFHLNHKSKTQTKGGALANSGVNEVQISIDGADKITYEKLRVGANYEQMVKNVYKFNKEYPHSKMWTVVQKDNYSQLKNLVWFASYLHFKQLTFGLDVGDWSVEGFAQDLNYNLSCEDGLYLVNEGKIAGVKVTFYGINEKYTTEHNCPWPFERQYVTVEGTSPCCMIADPNIFSYGEWDSIMHKEFRDAHTLGGDAIPQICRKCYKHG